MAAEKNQAAEKPLTVGEAFRKAELERRVQELVEKAARDRISMVAAAKAEGMVEAKQDAVLRYLEKRFGGVTWENKIRQVKDAGTLDRLFESLIDAGTPEEAKEVISRVLPP